MDSQMEQREFLSQKGEFIGAIRLPHSTFRANAGTEVITDIVMIAGQMAGRFAICRSGYWRKNSLARRKWISNSGKLSSPLSAMSISGRGPIC